MSPFTYPPFGSLSKGKAFSPSAAISATAFSPSAFASAAVPARAGVIAPTRRSANPAKMTILPNFNIVVSSALARAADRLPAQKAKSYSTGARVRADLIVRPLIFITVILRRVRQVDPQMRVMRDGSVCEESQHDALRRVFALRDQQ